MDAQLIASRLSGFRQLLTESNGDSDVDHAVLNTVRKGVHDLLTDFPKERLALASPTMRQHYDLTLHTLLRLPDAGSSWADKREVVRQAMELLEMLAFRTPRLQ